MQTRAAMTRLRAASLLGGAVALGCCGLVMVAWLAARQMGLASGDAWISAALTAGGASLVASSVPVAVVRGSMSAFAGALLAWIGLRMAGTLLLGLTVGLSFDEASRSAFWLALAVAHLVLLLPESAMLVRISKLRENKTREEACKA